MPSATCQVIVDDVNYSQEEVFEAGVIEQVRC